MSVININDYMARQTSHIFSSGMGKWEKTLSAQNQLMNESAMLADAAGNQNNRLLELYEQGNSVEVETRDLIRKARKMRNNLSRLTRRLGFSPAEKSYCL